jgi:hypothetical protein
MNRLIAAAAAVACVSTNCLAAEPQLVSEEALPQVVAGKTVLLHTRVGDIPIMYRANGTMVGRSGDLVAFTGQERDRGKWWVHNGMLCQQWETWLEGRAYCATIFQDGPTVHWVRNDGERGKATIVQPKISSAVGAAIR